MCFERGTTTTTTTTKMSFSQLEIRDLVANAKGKRMSCSDWHKQTKITHTYIKKQHTECKFFTLSPLFHFLPPTCLSYCTFGIVFHSQLSSVCCCAQKYAMIFWILIVELLFTSCCSLLSSTCFAISFAFIAHKEERTLNAAKYGIPFATHNCVWPLLLRLLLLSLTFFLSLPSCFALNITHCVACFLRTITQQQAEQSNKSKKIKQ